MNSIDDEELKRIRKLIIKIRNLGMPGAILIGLGLFGLFFARTDGLLSLLSDRNIAYGILAVGLVSEVWLLFIAIPVFKKHARLLRDKNT